MAGLSSENLLKDVFNERVIQKLAKDIHNVYRPFEVEPFVKEVVDEFIHLGFLQRSKHVRLMLKKYLPEDYPKAIEILLSALGPELSDPGETVWDAFTLMSQCDFVSSYGKGHYEESMNALYELTKRFTAEGDLRTFLEVDYEKTMKTLHEWCNDKSPHVRRLVSEGTRSRLPLSGRISRFQKNPEPVIELLDKLKDDPELYVRRSVANNLNDIAKDNPDVVVKTLKTWLKLKNPEVDWVIRHATRSLIKQGNFDALSLLGYSANPKVDISKLKLNKYEFSLKDSAKDPLVFSFEARSTSGNEENLMIDYVLHFVKANGKTKEKVFKLRKFTLAGGAKKEIIKKHTFKDTSGRKHYPGLHAIELQVNGKRLNRINFNLIAE